MEPPSRQLLDLLSRYALATPADLRRCRPQVRRLAHDLPTFDSVWIDALTQSRVITPFQARLLESEQPQSLQVGPCVLVEEWEKDGRWILRLARHRGSRQRCLLTFVDVPPNDRPKALHQCREMIARLRGLSHPAVLVPQGCDQAEPGVVVVSPYVTGPTLKQLLVRRGRFPIPVVMDIAWNLIDGLAALEKREVVHGDVSLINVRLTERGQVVLLNPGVLPAIGSRVSIHAPLGPDTYDGTAPELISSARTATLQSDLYATGCLLWQLLAGRPPYPTGDPLAKLAAHQTRSIDDVRRWVPDAPAELAVLIQQLTDKNAARRGSGPREIRDRWPLSTRFGRSRLVQFHSSFGQVAPRHGDRYRSASKFPAKSAAVLLCVLSGLSLSLLDAGARNELLRLAGHPAGVTLRQPVSSTFDGEHGHDAAQSEGQRSDLLPFPERPINGVIELTSAGPYAVADVHVDGPLTIRGKDGVMPQIVITGRPLRVSATQLRVEGVHLLFDTAADRATTLLAIECHTASVEGCRFGAASSGAMQSSLLRRDRVQSAAIAWKIQDAANPTGGKLVMRDTVINGPLHAVDTFAMPRFLGFDNCLKQGLGGLVQLSHKGQSAPLKVHLRQVTLRDSGGAIRWSRQAAAGSLQPLLLIAENSVFDVPSDEGALLEFEDQVPQPGWERMIRVTGEGSLLRTGMVLVASSSDASAHPTSLDSTALRIEGLLIDDFEFAGAGTHDPADSVVASSQAPLSTPIPPGIDARRLADSTAAPVVRKMVNALRH